MSDDEIEVEVEVSSDSIVASLEHADSNASLESRASKPEVQSSEDVNVLRKDSRTSSLDLISTVELIKPPLDEDELKESDSTVIEKAESIDALKDIRAAFDLFDLEHEGFLDPNKLMRGSRALGLNLSEAEIQNLLQGYAVEGFPRIEFDQVAEMMQSRATVELDVKAVFSIFDIDANGTIGLEDITKVAQQMGHYYSAERIKEILAAADINNNGSVMFNDFKEIFHMSPAEAKEYLIVRNAAIRAAEEEALAAAERERLAKEKPHVKREHHIHVESSDMEYLESDKPSSPDEKLRSSHAENKQSLVDQRVSGAGAREKRQSTLEKLPTSTPAAVVKPPSPEAKPPSPEVVQEVRVRGSTEIPAP